MQQAVAQGVNIVGGNEIALGDEDGVGKAHLALGLFLLVELHIAVLGVDQRDDGVQQVTAGDLIIHEEGLRDGAGVGYAGGLDDDAVELDLAVVAAREQVGQAGHQVTTDGAADAAVAHLHDLLVTVLHEDVVVDVLFTELVFDHGDLHAVLFGQDALEQRGLTAAEKARQDGDRDHFGHDAFPSYCRVGRLPRRVLHNRRSSP